MPTFGKLTRWPIARKRQTDVAEIFQQRFHRQKTDAGIHLAQLVDARQAIGAIFHGHPEPHVVRALAPGELARQAPGAFGENLVGMLGRRANYAEDLIEELVRNVFMKKVAHRIHEVDSGRLPPEPRSGLSACCIAADKVFLAQGRPECWTKRRTPSAAP